MKKRGPERGGGGREGPRAVAEDGGSDVSADPRRRSCPPDAFDEAMRHRDEYRKRSGGSRAERRAPRRRGPADAPRSGVLLAALAAAHPPAPGRRRGPAPRAASTSPGGADSVQQLTLWLAFVGGLVATREDKHLTLSTAELFGEGASGASAACWPRPWLGRGRPPSSPTPASGWWPPNREQGKLLPGGHPGVGERVRDAGGARPHGAALRLAGLRPRWPAGGCAPSLAIPAAFALGLIPEVPAACGPLAAAHPGGPGPGRAGLRGHGRPGPAAFLQRRHPGRGGLGRGLPADLLPHPARASRSSPPAATCWPRAGPPTRLLRFFRSLFGWMPGGLAVIVAAVCALFTTFTGGSGVTIIAVGGLVYPMLRKDGTRRASPSAWSPPRAAWACSSRPACPSSSTAWWRGRASRTCPRTRSTWPGSCPGLLMVADGGRLRDLRRPEHARPSASPSRRARPWPRPGRRSGSWACPSSSSASSSTGRASMVETAAAALVYAVVVECFLHRDLHPLRACPRRC